ncbi:MAG TPA: glycosyltransferase [Flavobacterium sp.]|nr:glycosyltransferase [Flavobacterium sp.]
MKILLLGEYSRLHNSLKEGLEKLGHQVTIVGSGDYFKNYPVDIRIENKYTKGIKLFIKKVIYKLFKIDVSSWSIKRQFFSHQTQLRNYDVVQLINENSFGCLPDIEIQLLTYIFKHNKNVFLLSCGTDYVSVKYAADNNLKYSVLTPFLEGRGSKKQFLHIHMRTSPPFEKLHFFLYERIKGVIASDLDYHLPLKNHPKYLGMIPNPINTDLLKYIDLKIEDKIIIFHGINTENYFKKGSDIFEAALDLVAIKHSDKIEIITVRSLPYKEYIHSFDRAHIVLDQVFSYDQGFNALEAMAKGKVVFTGADQEWLDYYKLKKDTVAINALPDAEKIAQKLEWLIENPDQLKIISKNARAFIEREHNGLNVATSYLKTWEMHSEF